MLFTWLRHLHLEANNANDLCETFKKARGLPGFLWVLASDKGKKKKKKKKSFKKFCC
jgi:hypothetical protein